MTNQIDDDDDGDDDDFYDMLGEDQWEDNQEFIKLREVMPHGWVMVKVINFTFRSVKEMETWLKTECRSKYEKVGFRSHCAYNVAVQFEDVVDATMFKLRWR